MDILVNTFANGSPVFTAKEGIKKWPFVGIIADQGFGAIFINRAGTK